MPASQGPKVLLAMSGGVDSSVAAALLLDQGFQVVGCFMRLGSENEVETEDARPVGHAAARNTCAAPAPLASSRITSGGGGASSHQGCCSVNDASDARTVAGILGIPFYVLNFKKDFGRIIDYFVNEYHAGRTPNPCVRCNDWLKFGKLDDYARSIDADFIATGHYARVERTASGARLLRGADHRKDQSYVLFGAKPDRLVRMMLPIGHLDKPRVRAIAQERGLPVFDKPDSQEICFVPDNDYASLVARRSPDRMREGDLLDSAGQVIGRHQGHQHFTIGQRRGLGVAAGHPLYVIQKDATANTVTVGDKDALLSTGAAADQTNWLVAPPPPAEPRRCQVKVRYNSQPVAATVRVTGEDSLRVDFDQPQSAVTPGQAVVCYDGDQVIGGGWIKNSISDF